MQSPKFLAYQNKKQNRNVQQIPVNLRIIRELLVQRRFSTDKHRSREFKQLRPQPPWTQVSLVALHSRSSGFTRKSNRSLNIVFNTQLIYILDSILSLKVTSLQKYITGSNEKTKLNFSFIIIFWGVDPSVHRNKSFNLN